MVFDALREDEMRCLETVIDKLLDQLKMGRVDVASPQAAFDGT
jgi:hypothetical protein